MATGGGCMAEFLRLMEDWRIIVISAFGATCPKERMA